MKAVIITIGDELLIGQTIDTNSSWIGAELSKLGFDVHCIVSVHDRREDILSTLQEVLGKADVALITGGLGPTSDDITKPTLCEFFNTKLVLNNEVLKMIEEMMTRRNIPMNENNRKQAEVPESCRVIKNARGTAPGMWFEKDGTIFISMPGVPYEMKYMMTEYVLPGLKQFFTSQIIIHKNIMVYGISESNLAEILTDFEKGLPKNIKLAYLPSLGVIKLRLTGTDVNYGELQKDINNKVSELYEAIPQFIYGEDEDALEKCVGDLLRSKKQTVCSAESCTGGNIASLITGIPGCSDYFKGSVVAYANSAKSGILGIPKELISRHGAVSMEVVSKMAENTRKIFGTDYCIATSGIAGPGGGTDTKPVGLAWLAVSSRTGVIAEQIISGTDRHTNIQRFSFAALNLLRKQILNS
ncbi:MAG: competence/damage-inducible protein A [Bacteroidales bacterium]|nr:competence/damage-inducible protein A [Bacteroidales bacterium]